MSCIWIIYVMSCDGSVFINWFCLFSASHHSQSSFWQFKSIFFSLTSNVTSSSLLLLLWTFVLRNLLHCHLWTSNDLKTRKLSFARAHQNNFRFLSHRAFLFFMELTHKMMRRTIEIEFEIFIRKNISLFISDEKKFTFVRISFYCQPFIAHFFLLIKE